MIYFKTLNKEQLKSFIESREYGEMPVIPISRHRAMSHINNPRALSEDILLILAYQDDELLGYLGILPDTLQNSIHVGWLSCIWTSPNARGKGIAKQMVDMAYQAYHHAIIITNYTKEAEHLYYKLGYFEPLTTLTGIRIYRKMCLSKILPKRYPKMKSITPLLTIWDGIFNFFWESILWIDKSHATLTSVQVKEITDWSNELSEFINETNTSIFHRSADELKWITSYPWIVQTKKFSEERMRYYFSSEEKQFKTMMYEIRKNQHLMGILIFVWRNGHLKIPYAFFKPDDVNDIVRVIKHTAIANDVSYITLFNQPLLNNLKLFGVYSKNIARAYLISKEIQWQALCIIYDGDGDAVFT